MEKVTKVICLKGSSRIRQGRKEQAEGKGKFQTEEQPAQRHRGVREAVVWGASPQCWARREVDPSQGASWAFLPPVDPDHQSGRLG